MGFNDKQSARIIVFLLGLVTCLYACVSFAKPASCREFNRTADGEIQLVPTVNNRKIGFEASIQNVNAPTLILMPGVYRGALSNDPTLVELTRRNINWLSIHLSTQPMSVDRGETLKATFNDVTTKVLKDEVVGLVKELCIKRPVYVGLSFSGALSTELTDEDTELAIDTTPIGTFTDGLPDGGLSYSLIDFWYSFNPLLKPEWTAFKESNYRTFWRNAIDEYIERYPNLAESTTLKEVAVGGYTSMSKAIEYYDLRKVDYSQGPKNRVFILAEKEDDGRRRIQLNALDKMAILNGKMPLTFVILGSGHNVLSDAPIAWAQTLQFVMTRAAPENSNVALVDKDGDMQWLTSSQWAIIRARLYNSTLQPPVVP